MYISIQVNIKGIVQGVFYRVSTQKKATQLGLMGWVKNNSDGSVEAVFEGESNKIEQILEWCENGPENASVESVSIISKEIISLKRFSRFEIK